MTMTVKSLAGIFNAVNSGNHARVNQLDADLWECNGLHIERDLIKEEMYTVRLHGDYVTFWTFGDAVEFCMTH